MDIGPLGVEPVEAVPGDVEPGDVEPGDVEPGDVGLWAVVGVLVRWARQRGARRRMPAVAVTDRAKP
ncbi:hypothetical protein ACBI99_26090 [Nonomuraea sp. ATR24]|uniref:hypothetical protein n=1 Tax=Nonomuraea sp. ATR24 TaxID=1676744 RepID=UPI0035C1C02E